jgi:hypothetical protein
MSSLVCTREGPDACDASCVVTEPRETFILRAGPAAYRAGAGSWATAEGTLVTVVEEAIYGKETPPKRTWTFHAKSRSDAVADADALNAFLSGTTPRVEVTFVTSTMATLIPWLPFVGLCVVVLIVWAIIRLRRLTS